jgi:hypothetical protein
VLRIVCNRDITDDGLERGLRRVPVSYYPWTQVAFTTRVISSYGNEIGIDDVPLLSSMELLKVKQGGAGVSHNLHLRLSTAFDNA